MLGLATGAIAGLAAVTPASGFIGPVGGFAIGLASGTLCYFASTSVKQALGYDDSLDVFGVHGIGGIIGTFLVAFFAAGALGGNQGDLAVGELRARLEAGGAIVSAGSRSSAESE